MTKFLKRMMLLALLSVPWVSQAQAHYNVQVGSGTDQYQYVPNYSYYDYSYSQMLYTANEIGTGRGGGTVAGFAWADDFVFSEPSSEQNVVSF